MSRDCDQLADLVAAYALHALETAEAETVERHLDGCESCGALLGEYLQIAQRLAEALPQRDPPPSLGQRLLKLARADLQTVSPGPFPTALCQAGHQVQRWWRTAAPRAALAAIGLAAISLGWALTLLQQLNGAEVRASEAQQQYERVRHSYLTIASVLASRETRIADLQAPNSTPAVWGRIWTDPSSGQGMMMAQGLPPPDSAHVYQVWLVRGDQRVSAGYLYQVGGGAHYSILQAPGSLADYQRVGVTLEPAGGSSAPTTPRVIGGEI